MSDVGSVPSKMCNPALSITVGFFSGKPLCRSKSAHDLEEIKYALMQFGTHFDFSSVRPLGVELSKASAIPIAEDRDNPNFTIIFLSGNFRVNIPNAISSFLMKSKAQAEKLEGIQADVDKFQVSVSDKSLGLTSLGTNVVLKGKDGKPFYLEIIVMNNPDDSFWVGSEVLGRFMEALGLSFGK